MRMCGPDCMRPTLHVQGFDRPAVGAWFWIEGLIDLFFYTDLVLNFLTAYEVGAPAAAWACGCAWLEGSHPEPAAPSCSPSPMPHLLCRLSATRPHRTAAGCMHTRMQPSMHARRVHASSPGPCVAATPRALALLLAAMCVRAWCRRDLDPQHPVTGELITSHKKIASRYLRTWFAVDFLATFPVDYIVRGIEVGGAPGWQRSRRIHPAIRTSWLQSGSRTASTPPVVYLAYMTVYARPVWVPLQCMTEACACFYLHYTATLH